MLYMPIWYALRWPLQVLYRLRFMHRERIPAEGPAVICANHASYLDPLLIALLIRRPIHYMAKSELFDTPALGWIMRGVRAFPVRRGTADRAAIKRAGALLEAGELVGVFPEGSRHSAGDAYGGAALIAHRAGVPVIPVGVSGTERIMPEGARFPRAPRVTVTVSEPLFPAGDAIDRREAVRGLTAGIMEGIRRAVESSRDAGDR
jgi:1-acyl-sn-glycerol-3-phosphate acyltransferase